MLNGSWAEPFGCFYGSEGAKRDPTDKLTSQAVHYFDDLGKSGPALGER